MRSAGLTTLVLASALVPQASTAPAQPAQADPRPGWNGWRDAWSIADLQRSASTTMAIPATSPIALKALPAFGSGRRI